MAMFPFFRFLCLPFFLFGLSCFLLQKVDHTSHRLLVASFFGAFLPHLPCNFAIPFSDNLHRQNWLHRTRRQQQHEGAAMLAIVPWAEKKVSGEYWVVSFPLIFFDE
jgi:hypothetical protein